MSDNAKWQNIKSENCPVCTNEMKEHTAQNFIDCIEKLFEKNEGKRHNLMNPTKLILTGNAKNQEALELIDKLLWNISDSKERWINKSVNHEAFNSFLDAVISNLEKIKKTLS